MGLFKNLLGTVLDEFRIGRENAGDKTIYANVASTNRPALRWNASEMAWSFSNNGVDFYLIGSAGISFGSIPLTLNETTDQASDMVVGALGITGASFGSATVKFVATAFVANSGLTGTIKLYNLTDSTTEATLSFTELISTHKTSSALTLNAGAKVYEIRIAVTGGAVPADVVACMWAGIELS
jgi:hypothetical protein